MLCSLTRSHLFSRALPAAAVLALALPTAALAQDKTFKIYGFGAKSGVVGIFGQQSEAAMQAAAAIINRAGGGRQGAAEEMGARQ